MSNAPCLYKDDYGNRCWATVSERGGYCNKHQPKPFANIKHGNDLPKNWASLTRQVLIRDKGICYRCGKPGADTADHYIARALGGTHNLSNLKAIHEKVAPHCHRQKTEEDIKKAILLNKNAPRKPVFMKDIKPPF